MSEQTDGDRLVRERHRKAAEQYAMTGAKTYDLEIRDRIAQALANQENEIANWVGEGAPCDGCYEETMEDRLDNMTDALRSGRWDKKKR